MKTLPYISLAAAALLMAHCAVDEEVKPAEPDADTTLAVNVTAITPYSAHIEGMFGSPDDTSAIAGIHYSLQNTRFISVTGDEAKAALTSRGNYSLDVEGLYSDTTYYFTTFVERDGTRYNSDTYKFRTHRLTASTEEVTDVYAYGAQLGFRLSEDIDPSRFKGSYGVYYSTRPRVIRESAALAKPPYAIEGLLPNHDYYCAAFVRQETAGLRDAYWWGETIKFTTPDLAVVTYEPSDVTTFSVRMSGNVDVKFTDVSEKGFLLFERNRDVSLDSVGAKSDQSITKVAATEQSAKGYGDFATTYRNLKSNKRYFLRAYAVVTARNGKTTTQKAYYGQIFEMRAKAVTMAEGETADMGLSVIWATANVGAKSVEKIGDLSTPESTIGTAFADGWRLPTLAEAKELVDSCHWSWGMRNGAYGAIVTEPAGTSIFLPANQKTGNAYTYGVYMVSDPIDERGRAESFRFVQDAENDSECHKTTENRISQDAAIGIRLVRDK